eukprot:2282682-Alexandrium_andersonii.AAC.1
MSSPCSEVLQGLVRKVLGEEVCWVLRSVDLDQSQQLLGHQPLKVQVPELNVLGLPAKSDLEAKLSAGVESVWRMR